jgi:two-component system chemotaxis response regulator CheB
MTTKRSVLVVDDSASFRGIMAAVIARAPDLILAGTAESAEEAWTKICQLNPDIITLDLELPGRDGFSLLERVMRERPRPVLMVCGRPQDADKAEARAIELGAAGILLKPGRAGDAVDLFLKRLVEAIRRAASLPQPAPARVAPQPAAPVAPAPAAPAPVGLASGRPKLGPDQPLVAIGASTGGVEAVRAVLSGIARARPAVVIVQHMLPGYAGRFAARLGAVTGLRAMEAQDGLEVEPGLIIVGPDRMHLTLEQRGGRLVSRLLDSPPISGHKPSVDAMFQSLARIGRPAVAALLTGMGRDGARGLLALKQAGAHTIAQDEATSTVYGMPAAAAELGAPRVILPLDSIAGEIVAYLEGRATGADKRVGALTRARAAL